MVNYGSSPTLHNSIVWGNTPNDITDYEGSSTASHSLIGDRGDPDPQFVDAAAGDLRLQPGSPAIDAGSNYLLPADALDLDGDGNTTEPLPVDLVGQARVVDGDGDGTATVDMGAYEFCPTGACPPSAATTQVSAFTAQPATGSVTLTWQTGREVELTGFHLYRTPATGGEAVRITESLIPATGSASTGASYQLTDQPGAGRYVYELELVQQDAQSVRQGQVEVEVAPAPGTDHQLHLPLLERR
jgi:hypothetical protein